jgi:hypothetical protein
MRTQTRVRIDAASKNADNTVRGKVQIEDDWATWGKFEATAGAFKLREAWVDFNLPGLPGHLKGGHQLLQLGQGWFFRSMKFGSDAWLLGFPGKNTLAFLDVKYGEYDPIYVDDVDAYVILDVFKIDDNNTVGIDLTSINDRGGNVLGGTDASLNNIGVNYTGKLGPVNLKAEIDVQMGSATKGGVDASANVVDKDYSGNQIVIQATMPMDALTVNLTVARGSGDDTSTGDANEGIVTLLDKDPHYTFLYEYNVATAAGAKNTGFANTTALNVGANYAISKTLSAGADVWLLKATEVAAGQKDDLGMEIDAKLVWKMYDALTFSWMVGLFQPGDFYGTTADDVTGSQWVLGYKF